MIKRILKESLEAIAILSILITFILLANAAADIQECKKIKKVLNYKTEWHFSTGCTIYKPDDTNVRW